MSRAATAGGADLSLETARRVVFGLLALVGIAAIVMPEHLPALVASPLAGGDGIATAINDGIDRFVAVFKPALRAVAGGLDWAVRGLQKVLHATPWPFIVVAVTWLAWRLKGPGLAALCGTSVLYMALSGYWLKSMNTLSMVGVAVPLALAVGFGLGVLGAKSRRANAILQPTLDLMQTIPTFAYLAPLVVLFGFGPVPGVLASMIYAAPPMTRNVMLGLQSVPQELREVSSMSGTTPWQRFRYRAALRQAADPRRDQPAGAGQPVDGDHRRRHRRVRRYRPRGAGRHQQGIRPFRAGLGGRHRHRPACCRDRQIDARCRHAPGNRRSRIPILWQVAGLALVLAASIVLKTYADLVAVASAVFFRLGEVAVNGWLQDFIATHGMTLDAIKNNALVYLLLPLRIGLTKAVLPVTWGFTFTSGMQTAYLLVVLAGAAWLAWRGRMTAAGLLASVGLIAYCGFTYMPWWVMFAGVGWLAWRHAGWRFSLVACGMILAITVTGHWQGALYSVYLCSAAILVCLVIGCPLGVLAAKSDVVSGILRPVNDTLQSIPLYIFLIPAVALFQVNEFSALVAIVLYAIVPLIRYTEHGLRHVPPTLVEAARANGCSPLQRLLMIELPVARPAILLGLNQTVLFALAMLIIAVLVGARGLAEQVNIGLRDADTGLGMTAGLSMAFIAIIADRILRGYANSLGSTDIGD